MTLPKFIITADGYFRLGYRFYFLLLKPSLFELPTISIK